MQISVKRVSTDGYSFDYRLDSMFRVNDIRYGVRQELFGSYELSPRTVGAYYIWRRLYVRYGQLFNV